MGDRLVFLASISEGCGTHILDLSCKSFSWYKSRSGHDILNLARQSDLPKQLYYVSREPRLFNCFSVPWVMFYSISFYYNVDKEKKGGSLGGQYRFYSLVSLLFFSCIPKTVSMKFIGSCPSLSKGFMCRYVLSYDEGQPVQDSCLCPELGWAWRVMCGPLKHYPEEAN